MELVKKFIIIAQFNWMKEYIRIDKNGWIEGEAIANEK